MPANEERDPNLLNFIATTVETIPDKVDGLESRIGGIENRFDGLENRMEAGVTAVRGDIERVHLRLDSIERMLSARLDRV